MAREPTMTTHHRFGLSLVTALAAAATGLAASAAQAQTNNASITATASVQTPSVCSSERCTSSGPMSRASRTWR